MKFPLKKTGENDYERTGGARSVRERIVLVKGVAPGVSSKGAERVTEAICGSLSVSPSLDWFQ